MGTQPNLAAQRSGAGPALVLVHGDFNTGRMAWRRQIEGLTDRTLLVPDRRGYGDGPPLAGPHAIAAEAGDILDAADGAGFASFDLAGHSYGGLVSVAAALRAPDRVRSLVLVEPPWLALLPDDPEVAALASATSALWDAAADLADEAIASAFFGIVAGPGDAARLAAAPAWPALVAQARRAVRGEPPGAFPAAALDALPPALGVCVLSGGRSHPGLRAIAREIVERRPRTAFVCAPDQGHNAQADVAAFRAALAAAGA